MIAAGVFVISQAANIPSYFAVVDTNVSFGECLEMMNLEIGFATIVGMDRLFISMALFP